MYCYEQLIKLLLFLPSPSLEVCCASTCYIGHNCALTGKSIPPLSFHGQVNQYQISVRQTVAKTLKGTNKKKRKLNYIKKNNQQFCSCDFFFSFALSYHQIGKLVEPRSRGSLCCHYSCFHGSSSTSVHSAAEPLVAEVTCKQLAGKSKQLIQGTGK